ncbi:hypothetical protein, partial [Neisseria gonorrhoeae]|uniref:hypothetical protein n=1 Tax=Neisseria gonorrhoeae TaxID=485 RepID=UPI001F43D32D
LPLAALVSGVLFTWLLMKGRFQGEFAGLNAQLAEKAARCDFIARGTLWVQRRILHRWRYR